MASLGHTVVPNYNVYGQQHPKHPFKDKSAFLSSDVTQHKWFDPAPDIRTRSELMQARRCSNLPSSSYDFDNDGVVGQQDYLIGRFFDKNADGHLTPSERKRAEEAVAKGFMDGFRRVEGGRVKQVGGKILDEDNATAVTASLYPAHYNSHVVPKHATLSELRQSRAHEMKTAGGEIGDRYAQACASLEERQPPNARTHPRTCPISSIRERAEADHQHSRTQGGLLPMNTMINPEREHMTVGLGYREAPPCATRGQLLEKRREDFTRNEIELRLHLDEFAVPHSVRKAEREAKLNELRAPQDKPKTRSEMRDARRRDKREYDNANFGHKERELPRFSDKPDVPFWIAGSPNKIEERQAKVAGDADGSMRQALRSHKEPVLKVTQVPFHCEAPAAQRNAPAVAATATVSTGLDATAGKPGEKLFTSKPGTMKRFTADYLERGLGPNKPRFFDCIQPIRVGPLDLESLDATSSMEIIRKGALSDQNTELQRGHLRRSILYTEPGIESVEQDSVDTTPHPSLVVGEQALSREPRKRVMNAPTRVQSDPSLRTMAERGEPMAEPRSFAGTGTASRATSTHSQTGQVGVRCGGFQRLDWPPRSTRQEPPRRGSKPRERLHSNNTSVRESVGAAQPL